MYEKNVADESARDAHTPTYEAIITGGKSTDSCDDADAERPSMNTVASGVRVTDAWVAAMRLITQTGMSAMGSKVVKTCATAAEAKKSGKMMPPGKPPAHARAMAQSLAAPTARAANGDANGWLTSTMAREVRLVGSPGQTAAENTQGSAHEGIIQGPRISRRG